MHEQLASPSLIARSRSIEHDVAWFEEALRNGLIAEAANIVWDWASYWFEGQRAQDGFALYYIARRVARAGTAVLPFLAAYARIVTDPDEHDYLTHWLTGIPAGHEPAALTSAAQAVVVNAGLQAITQACSGVYQLRKSQQTYDQHRQTCNDVLRFLLGTILNHGMREGLLRISEDFSLLAREVFFRDLHRKRSLLPPAADEDRPLRRLIRERWPESGDDGWQLAKRDGAWQFTLIYALSRLVHFWLERPLGEEDFLQVCAVEGMDLTRNDLQWMVRSGVIGESIWGMGGRSFSIRQVFALSAAWYDWLELKRTDPRGLRQKYAAAYESVTELLAFMPEDSERLNAAGWARLTHTAREQREALAEQPARRLWVDGMANLAATLLFAIGVRPIAPVGRARLAPDDPVLLTLEELVLGYYRTHKAFRGCAAWIRRATLDEELLDSAPETRWPGVISYFRTHAPTCSARVTDERGFYQDWRTQFGAKLALERAIDDVRATIEIVADEEGQLLKKSFGVARAVSRPCLPLLAPPVPSWALKPDVMQYATTLADGKGRDVACCDTRMWIWWFVPRAVFRHTWLHGPMRRLLASFNLPLLGLDMTKSMVVEQPQAPQVLPGPEEHNKIRIEAPP